MKKAGIIGRFKPLHKGGAALLESICEQAEHVTIGIGSCNEYNARNSFTAEETKDMIDAILAPKYDNYKIIYIPDFCDEEKWTDYIIEHYGTLDCFVSGNEYVNHLLKGSYDIIRPNSLILPGRQTRITATEVRYKMANDEDWESLVPLPVADYIKQNNLDKRFIKEFGLEAIAKGYKYSECIETEKRNVMGT
ncbi:hypothetical protein GOV06_03215 [Candidatus Woesearchaeota archaeon]|nr:hypothetical protein [Candidatus Woesearchaeota archaeon]